MSSADAVLEYKKGEGWVYETVKRHEVIGRDGEVYYLLERCPEIGEHWIARVNAEDCVKDMTVYRYRDFYPITERDLRVYGKGDSRGFRAFTIEKGPQ